MHQQHHPLTTNYYIPKSSEKRKYEWFEHDLTTYIDDLKYKHFIEGMDSHFSWAKITNFDIIHQQCHGDPLQNSCQYYETIFNSDFKGYEDPTRNQAMSTFIKAERDDIHFESNLLKLHGKLDIKKDLISNVFL